MNLLPILAQAQQAQQSRYAFTVFGILFLLLWTLPILGIIWLVRYLLRAARERQRLRLELGKLAEEVHLLRRRLDPNEQTPPVSTDPSNTEAD